MTILSDSSKTSGDAGGLRWDYLWFALAAVFEFLVFDRLTTKNFAHFYPPWNDQVQYLSEVYNAFEAAKAHGFFSGLHYAITKPAAQGMLDCPLTLCLFEITGASRSAPLAMNILFVIAFQFTLFRSTLRVFGSRLLAWGSFAVAVGWQTVFAGGPGSGSDFRLDLMAACAFGISLTALLTTEGLRRRSESIFFGVSVGVAILVRFLTANYFAVLFIALFVWLIRSDDAKKRIANLSIAALIAAALSLPIFWINRQWIWDYYVIGHYFGPESSIRKSGLDVLQSVEFVVREGFLSHAGGWLIVTGIVIIALAWIANVAPAATTQQSKSKTGYWLVPATIYLLSPILILSLHQQKSPVVESVIVPPLIVCLVGLAAWVRGWGRLRSPMLPTLAGAGVALCVATSFFHFVKREENLAPSAGFVSDARKVNALVEYIYQKTQKYHLPAAKIGTDKITDSLDAQIFRVICYEHHQVWQNFDMTLPTSIAAAPENELMERVKMSDFVFIAVKDGGDIFPYDAEMHGLREKHRAWCQTNLQLVETFDLAGNTWEFYQRRFPTP